MVRTDPFSRGKSQSARPLFFALALAVLAALLVLRFHPSGSSAGQATRDLAHGCGQVMTAFHSHRSGDWVTLSASVQRLLSDRGGRLRHQRFIVTCTGGEDVGRTVEVVNDISIGIRAPVKVGDSVGVKGRYVWNALGGLVHFTHHDPQGGLGGWILLAGKIYH